MQNSQESGSPKNGVSLEFSSPRLPSQSLRYFINLVQMCSILAEPLGKFQLLDYRPGKM